MYSLESCLPYSTTSIMGPVYPLFEAITTFQSLIILIPLSYNRNRKICTQEQFHENLAMLNYNIYIYMSQKVEKKK